MKKLLSTLCYLFSRLKYRPVSQLTLLIGLTLFAIILGVFFGVGTLHHPKHRQLSDNTTYQTHLKSVPVKQPKNWKVVTVESGDNLAVIFKRLKLNHKILHQIMELGDKTESLEDLNPGQKIEFQIDKDGVLQKLKYEPNVSEIITVEKQDDQYTVNSEEAPITLETAHQSAIINHSLYSAAKKANIPNKITDQLIRVFGWSIDFKRQLQSGDSFSVIYQKKLRDGKVVGMGDIVAANFFHKNKTYTALRYQLPNGKVGYYTPTGQNMVKAFLRAPLNYQRITSSFNPKRRHPILHILRPHYGVDFGAPRGTPIEAAGDGRISYLGYKGGYGKYIRIRHNQKYATCYGHMSKFAKGLKRNSWVKQGQIIGYVGSTGLSTGPHLHYEFRIYNKPRNPLTVALPQASPIPTKDKKDFANKAQPLIASLDQYRQTMLAANK